MEPAHKSSLVRFNPINNTNRIQLANSTLPQLRLVEYGKLGFRFNINLETCKLNSAWLSVTVLPHQDAFHSNDGKSQQNTSSILLSLPELFWLCWDFEESVDSTLTCQENWLKIQEVGKWVAIGCPRSICSGSIAYDGLGFLILASSCDTA